MLQHFDTYVEQIFIYLFFQGNRRFQLRFLLFYLLIRVAIRFGTKANVLIGIKVIDKVWDGSRHPQKLFATAAV